MKDALREKILASKPGSFIPVTSQEMARIMSGEMDEVMAEIHKREDGLQQMAGDNYVKRAQQSLDQTEPVPPTFEEVVKPLIKWMAENNCPHSHVVVTGTSAELFHGMKSFNTFEFVSD